MNSVNTTYPSYQATRLCYLDTRYQTTLQLGCRLCFSNVKDDDFDMIVF